MLRIDDTDAERTVAGAEDAILEDLGWLGIGWDEGPVRQSSRAERHVEAANLAEHTTIRDGALFLSPPGVRPFVIVRGDGRPTYHWASVVDDLDFGITHVIRGGDHRANEDLHAAGFRALGAEPPAFIHHASCWAATASCPSGRATPRSPTCVRPGIRRRPSSTCWASSRAPAPARCSTWTSWWRGSSPTGSPAATCASTRPGCGRSRRSTWPGSGTPSWWRRSCRSAGRDAGRRRRGDGSGAPRRTHAGRGGGAGRMRARHARRAATLPELAELRRDLPEQLDEMQARELVDELRRRGIPLKGPARADRATNGPELWAVLAALPRDEAVRRAA